MTHLVMLALATFRLARLLVNDEGPGELFQRWRVFVGVYDYSAQGEPRTSIGRLFACPYCTGVWCALLLYPLRHTWIVRVLAVAGGQSLIESANRWMLRGAGD